MAANPDVMAAGRPDIKAIAGSMGDQYGIDPEIVYGVIMTESSGNPNSSNPSDPSVGLMGVQALIGRAYAGLQGTDTEVLSQLYDVPTNLAAGCGFLAHLDSRYGELMNVHEWVQAYNLGETKFDKGIRNPSYGDRVVKFMGGYSGA